MGIFSFAKNKGELVAVFDIGSSFVGVVFLMKHESGLPHIVYSLREPIEIFDKKTDPTRVLFLTMKSLESLVLKAFQAKVGKPKKIFCILSSPLYISQTRIINFKKNESFIFTAKFADDLIKKEIILFEQEYLKKYAKTGTKFRSIDFKNIKTMLNGYSTQNPIDQKTEEVEMNLFLSMGPEKVLKKIEEIIQKSFPLPSIKFSSFALSSFAVIRDMYTKNNEDFVLVDIGGEVTDISLVKNSVLSSSVSFPMGSNFIIRSLAESLKIPISEAESMVSLVTGGHSVDIMTQKSNLIFSNVQRDWLLKFQESLSHISNDVSMPSTIFLSVDKNFIDLFSTAISKEQFTQQVMTDGKFKIILLDSKSFHSMVVFDRSLNSSLDANLLIDSIYINRLLK